MALKAKTGHTTYGCDLDFAVAAEHHSDTVGTVPAAQFQGSCYLVEFHMLFLCLRRFPQGFSVSSYLPKKHACLL